MVSTTCAHDDVVPFRGITQIGVFVAGISDVANQTDGWTGFAVCLARGCRGYYFIDCAGVFLYTVPPLAVSRRKMAEEEARRLDQEKQLVAVQAILDGEAAECTRLAKDLHDGLGVCFRL